MFGYINVNRKELNAEDEKTYQAYYCGLCRQLKNEAGIKGQMLLNYDMTFLLILLTGLYELEHEEISYRCAVHPAAKKTAYINAATEYAAAMDIVLSYHSLQDDYEDEGSHIKQAMAKALLKDYKRISIRYPRQVQAVEEYMKKLAVECRDVYFEKMLETYRKRPTKFRAKRIAAMLHKTKHAAVVDRLTQKLQDATKGYKRRFPGEALEKGYREVFARVERRQEELKKQGIRADILREEPFTIARDSLDYKLYLMIWKERRGNRITEIEEYIC